MSFWAWCYRGLAASLCVVSVGVAQEAGPARGRPYDGIQAGLEAFRLAEERRQAEVAGQVALNELLWCWPVWPGPVWPYMSAGGMRARQSIGQRQEQTGARRWESHPVYSPPLAPYLPLPLVASPWLDNTSYAAPRVLDGPRVLEGSSGAELVPAKPAETLPPPPPLPEPPRRGPREY